MKILILANSDVGLYQFRKELIEELLKENKVYISLPYGDLVDSLVEMNCKFIETMVDRRGINPIKDLKLLTKYKKIISDIKPDLVITYTIKPNVYGGMICRLMRIPYVVNITGLGTAFENDGLLKRVVTLMNRFALKNSKVVFFENEDNRQTFVKEKIIPMKKTYRLNGAGVNLEKFSVAEYPNNEKINFLFMGRVMAEKGIDELFQVMHILSIDRKIECELSILGGYEENYEDKIKKYEAEGWLKYYGYQKDVRPFIKKANCLVLPSWHEGMANTNLECAASGRPIITSNIPGCKEAVEDGLTGYLCERKNPDDLYKVMKQFAELSYEERKTMGLAGRKRMEKHFDKRKIVKETIREMER